MKKLNIDDLTGRNTDNIQLVEKLKDDIDDNDIISLLAMSELVSTDDPEKLKTISRVKYDQIPLIAKLELYADTFDVPIAKKLSSNLLKLLISTNGLGRKELVQLVQKRFDTLELSNKLTSKDIYK